MFEKKDQSTALIIGVSIFCLLVVFSIFAWTGPPGTPPDPNAPAPINVSSSGQEKEGQVGIAIPSGQFLDGSYGLTVGTASNPLGIKTSGDSFFESAFTSFKGIALDDAASGKNLIPNWQMESDTYWTDNLEQTSVADFNGVNHYAHRSDETDTGCYNWAHTALIPADANKLYKFSIWIKSDDSTMNNYFGFHIYDSNKTRIVGDWSNPYFKTSEGDANSWRKWTAYLGPSYSDIATGCDSGKTNGNDWCMAADTAYIKMRFGACYGDGGSNGYSWFMYPKIEEVDPDDSYFVGNTVFMDGNVGIGTTAPGTKLDVNGDMFVQRIGPKYSTWSGIGDGGAAVVNDNNAYKSLMIVGSDQNNADGRCDNLRCIRMWDRVTVEGELYTTGNVGIGTTSPGEKLSVNGNISVSGTGMWNHSGTVVYSGTPSAETWLTLDLSSYVGANHALVFLRFYDRTSGGIGYWLRTGALLPLDFGSDARTDDTSGCAAVNVRNNNQGIGYVMIETDSDGKTHWKAGSAHLTQIVLVGYIK